MKDHDLQLIAEKYGTICEYQQQQSQQPQQPNLYGQVAKGYAKSQVPSLRGGGNLGALDKMAVQGAKWGSGGADALKTAQGATIGAGKMSTNISNPVGTLASIGSVGAGLMQGSEMQKAVDAGEITPQAAAAELAAGAKPKGEGDGKSKLLKSSAKPKKEANEEIGDVYMEQMFNPNLITTELVQYALGDPAAMQQLLSVVPSLGTHPEIAAAIQQQQMAAQQQQTTAVGVAPQQAIPGGELGNPPLQTP